MRKRGHTASLLLLMWSVSVYTPLASSADTNVSDILIDGVPLPADASTEQSQQSGSVFAGAWVGAWGGWLKTLLLVESVEDDGSARVIYAIGDNAYADIKAKWYRFDAEIDNNTMTVIGNGFRNTYTATETGKLAAIFTGGRSVAVMDSRSLETLLDSQDEFRWDTGVSEFLPTDLDQDGQSVQLEAVVFKPPGKGPFPLAVVNHGSTGRGHDESLFSATWVDLWFAELLNARGWIVAFPQRRGRGRSDGLYDEGFNVDRRQGYTCNEERSLAGADRALEDLAVSVAALRERSDVQADHDILLVGNSQGGALSLTYAGEHGEHVAGVINFVGGWLGDLCGSAQAVNQALFTKSATFHSNTLWLYGNDDSFYTIEHSRDNFDAFTDAGGRGHFETFTIAGDANGHWVMANPSLWQTSVDAYLDAM